jgi:hypothetical protein
MLLEWAMALSLSRQGHSVGCSQMGHCCRPDYGWHPPHAMAQQIPFAVAQQTPSFDVAQQTPPPATPQTPATVAQ